LDTTKQRAENLAMLEEGIAATKAREEELERADEISRAAADRWAELKAKRGEPALAPQIAAGLFSNPEATPSSPEEAQEAVEAIYRTADSIGVAQAHAQIKQEILNEGLGHNIAHALSGEEIPTVTPQVNPNNILPRRDVGERIREQVTGEYEKTTSFSDEIQKVAARAVAGQKAEES
jgi:hypothetical protein